MLDSNSHLPFKSIGVLVILNCNHAPKAILFFQNKSSLVMDGLIYDGTLKRSVITISYLIHIPVHALKIKIHRLLLSPLVGIQLTILFSVNFNLFSMFWFELYSCCMLLSICTCSKCTFNSVR